VTAEPYITLNAVVVSTATQRNFELISEFIRQLDVPTPEEQREITRLIRLEYASAEDTAELLESIWSEGEDGGSRFSFGRFFATGGRLEQKDVNSLRGQVEIGADIQTNSVLVRTAQRYMPQVQAMIEELDFVRGQVWIDIQILEVTLDETTKLGIELTAQENRIFGEQLRSGNPLVGNVDTQLGLDQEISGFTYSIATKEYMGLLHTLMRENKVKTLSTPSLLTRDNQQATWSRGRTIPYLQSVDTTSLLGEGVNQPLFNYDFISPPVGINITITPHIAKSLQESDGKRTIGLDIEQIQASNFIEFTDFNAPITEDSSISAYIDVEDGQQIVVGGMIKSKQQEIESKVPLLGDIPLIGRLFMRTETVSENSEIVIIITPHIVDIKNPEDLDKLRKEAEKWRSNNDQEESSQEQ
jgi:general secretion pathway protein D